VASQTSLLRGQGGYLQLANGDDGIAYGGAHAEEQVFIVGKGTPEERVFAQDNLVGASAYARAKNRTLITQSAGALPNAAMRELFGELEAGRLTAGRSTRNPETRPSSDHEGIGATHRNTLPH
jgi:hypothetical protein